MVEGPLQLKNLDDRLLKIKKIRVGFDAFFRGRARFDATSFVSMGRERVPRSSGEMSRITLFIRRVNLSLTRGDIFASGKQNFCTRKNEGGWTKQMTNGVRSRVILESFGSPLVGWFYARVPAPRPI